MNVQSFLRAHGWLGLGLAALRYLICLTCTIAVLQEDLQQLEDQSVVSLNSLPENVAQIALANTLELASHGQPIEHLYLRFPTEALPRAAAGTDRQMFNLDAQGRLVSEERIDWTEFLVALHRSLSLPELLGAALVGAAGAALGSLILTGLLGHPRIFRNAFRLRVRDDSVAPVDWHIW